MLPYSNRVRPCKNKDFDKLGFVDMLINTSSVIFLRKCHLPLEGKAVEIAINQGFSLRRSCHEVTDEV